MSRVPLGMLLGLVIGAVGDQPPGGALVAGKRRFGIRHGRLVKEWCSRLLEWSTIRACHWQLYAPRPFSRWRWARS